MKPLKDDESSPYLIAAGGRIDIAAAGRYVRCLEADGLLEVSFNNGSKTFFGAGLERRLPEQSPDFEQITVFNPNGADVNCVLSWGYGTLKDDRLAASGNLNVITPAGTALKTDDDEAQTLLATIQASIERSRFIDLSNATIVNLNNNSSTLVADVDNLNGIYLHYACLRSGNAAESKISIGGVELAGARLWANGQSPFVLPPMELPSGQALFADANGGDSYITVAYEVLP